MIKKRLRELKSLMFRVRLYLRERKENSLKYLFYPAKNSDKLVISFAGFPGGSIPRYNYIKTLEGIQINRLYLLDDVGSKVNIGSYYLGTDGKMQLVPDIIKLIQRIVKEYGIQTVITIGSSKGGWSALYYGLKIHADYCIIGAPQYYVGSYLSSEKHLPILQSIMGSTDDSAVETLDHLLKKEIEKRALGGGGTSLKVVLHYSKFEHTYVEHIKYLIEDLEKNGIDVEQDCNYSYTDHDDVKYHFPTLLRKKVEAVITNE